MKKFAVIGATAIVATALGIGPLLAQVKVVTVTAQKRAEDVQDVPMSISAYSGDFLESKGIDAINELNNYTPNFRVDTGNNPRNSSIKIRGVGSTAGNAGVEQSVGTFVDGVYVPRVGALLGDITDISTVEVLRGPQGTLYGRNTSVGALNINTREATQEFSAYARVGFGNYDQRNVGGYINGGITDNLAARFTFWASDFAGYEKNLVSGSGANSRENFGGRAKLKWEANDATDVQLIADYTKQITVCCTYDYGFVDLPMLEALNQAALGTGIPLSTQSRAFQSASDHVVAQGGNQNNEDEQWGLALIMNNDLGGNLSGHYFKSVTTYRRWDNNGNFSQGDTYLNFQLANQTQVEKTLSQEFNLTSPDGGVNFFTGTKLEYILGAYFYKQRSNATTGTAFDTASIFLPGVKSAANGSGAPCTGAVGSATCTFANITKVVGLADFNNWNQHARSYAFFGQTTLHIIPDVWSVTGGVRYSKDKKKAYMDSTYIAGQRGLAATGGGQFNQQFNNIDYITFPEEDAITWLANTRYYITPDINVYFTASTGYKSPGSSSRPYRQAQAAVGQPVSFGSERSNNFEAGFKSTLFDDRLVVNVDVFRTTISNFQQSLTNPALGPGAFIVNLGKLRQRGVEVELHAAPMDWLELDGSVALLDSNWVDFTNGQCAVANTAGTASQNTTDYVAGTTFCNFNTHPNSYSPKWNAHLGGTITFPLLNTALEWFTSGDWSYNGSYFSDELLDARSEISRYMLFGAKLGIKGGDGDWQLVMWGENLLNTTYYTSKTGAAGANFFGFGDSRRWLYGKPRTFGLMGNVRF